MNQVSILWVFWLSSQIMLLLKGDQDFKYSLKMHDGYKNDIDCKKTCRFSAKDWCKMKSSAQQFFFEKKHRKLYRLKWKKIKDFKWNQIYMLEDHCHLQLRKIFSHGCSVSLFFTSQVSTWNMGNIETKVNYDKDEKRSNWSIHKI